MFSLIFIWCSIIRVDGIKFLSHYLYRPVPQMDSSIEIVMRKLIYTENFMMFGRSGREPRRFESFVFYLSFVIVYTAEIPLKWMSK
jgi:hypothetical protein